MAARTTVDRLDKPSAYFNSRVYTPPPPPLAPSVTTPSCSANVPLAQKKRGGHHQRDRRDEDDDMGRQPEQPEEDPLKDATTLYVGNLYVPCLSLRHDDSF